MIRPVFGIDIGNFMELNNNLCFTGTLRGGGLRKIGLFFLILGIPNLNSF